MKVIKKDVLKLLDFVEDGDQHSVDLQLEAMVTPNGRRILGQIEELLLDMKSGKTEAMSELEGDLANAAAFKCQNAIEQLEYIVREGTAAAHNTLEMAENIQAKIAQLDVSSQKDTQILAEINTNLIDIMVAQGYQDLSEQVVIKLTNFVLKLEMSLGQIVDLNKAVEDELELGPSVTRSEKSQVVEDQGMVDDIINNVLGG